ncbi:MAG TPA: hypothetical protein VE988_03465, partial [Gemmataceae bacterium]|nr:hypothetical protein [Gemmataceae bacterium]
MGDLDAKTPGLWIDNPGQPTVRFDWSRRGTLTADGLHFDILVPVCANAQLELKLPSDYQVVATKAGLHVDGPYDSSQVGLKTWTVSFSGRSRVEFVLRRVPTGTALLLASVLSRQELGPDRLLADYEFQIEALHGAVTNLVFDGDTALQPYDVTLGGVEVKDWEWQVAAEKGTAGGVLVVPLREPQHGILPMVRVRCLAPQGKDKKNQVWVSPSLRLRGAVPRGETLRVHALAEAQLEQWKPGQFNLRKTTTETDGSQVLTLVHDGSAKGALPQRPSAVLKARTTELLLEQQSWWQLDVQGSTLHSVLVCKVSRGQLYHLPLKLPPDSQVDHVSAEPKELLRGWAASGTRKEPLLLIDMAQAVTPRMPLRIKVRLRLPPGTSPKKGALALTLPDISPLLPCLREGALAVSIDPRWQAEVVQSSWPATAAPEGLQEGPWQTALLDYYFAFREKPLTGQLRLFPRAPQFQARCQSDAFLSGDKAALITRLTIEPTSGSLDYVDLLVSAPLADKWKVRGEAGGVRVASLQQVVGADLPYPAPRQAQGEAKGEQAKPIVQHWRLRFAEPLRSKGTFVLEGAFGPTLAGEDAVRLGPSWDVPIVTIMGSDLFEGELAVQLAGTEVIAAETDQLQELPRPATKNVARNVIQPVWRTYRYDTPPPGGRGPTLQVKTRATTAQSVARESCDLATVTTYVEPGGRLVHQFHFRLVDWRKRDVPVILPLGAKVLAARIEGRWLASLPQQQRQDGIQVDLPASSALGMQHFNLYFAMPEGASSWAPWETLLAPMPVLPLTPLDVRQSWVLPPGVVPVGTAWQRVAGGPAGPVMTDWDASAKKAWHIGQPLLGALLPEFAAPSWATVQKQHLASAEAALRRRFGPESGWVLGPVLEHLALGQLPDDVPLVIDAVSLAEAGVSADTAFAQAPDVVAGEPWARLRLVMAPTPGGLLLTTRQQWQHWVGAGDGDYAVQGPLADAVAEAAQRGHDSTGRFYAASFWLRHSPTQDAADIRGLLSLDSFGADWTHWDANATAETRTEITVVRPLTMHGLGALLACLLALLWGSAATRMRSPRWRMWPVRGLILWAMLAFLAALWLPAPTRPLAMWPAATALILGLAWHMVSILQRRRVAVERPPSVPRSVAAAAAIMLTVLIVAASLPRAWSQGADQGTVLVLPATTDLPEQVLVTPELLKRLDTLVQRGPNHQRGAVLLGANYNGTVTGDVARFKAEFQLFSFSDNAALTLPLSGVELGEGAMLDGIAAQLAASPVGYTVTVKDKGPHKLTVAFSVRVQSTPEHRDLQFNVPRLYQNKLVVQLPITMADTQVISGSGMVETATVDARTQQLTVDLGRDIAVQLRWATSRTATGAAKATVQEAYYWDLRGPGSECTAVLNYSIKGSSLAQLTVALPSTLEARAVEIGGEGPGGDEAARPRLRDWRLVNDNGQWRLRIQLLGPVTGNVVVILHLVPRQPFGPGTARLELPEPLDGKSTGGLVAYRVEGWDAGEKPFNMLTSLLPAEQFAKQWQATGAKEPVSPTRAFSFRNYQSGGALVLSLTPWRPALEQDLRWTLQPGRADLLATVKFTAGGDDLMMVEWEVPPQVTVAEIAGDNIRTWTRPAGPAGDGKLQLWLKQPARSVTFIAHGWMMYAKPIGGQAQRWTLPWLGSSSAVNTATIVRVSDGAGIRAELDGTTLQNLATVPLSATPTWMSQGAQAAYQAEFVIRPVPLAPRLMGITSAEARGGMLHLAGQWQVHVPHAGLAEFHVRVVNWSGAALKLEGPRELTIVDVPSPAGQQSWKITVPTNAPRRLQLKLSGARPCQAG